MNTTRATSLRGLVESERARKYLFGICLRMLDDWHTAEDMLQTSLARLCELDEKFTPGSSVMGFACTVVRQFCLNHLAKRRRRRTHAVADTGAVSEDVDHADRLDTIERADAATDILRNYGRKPERNFAMVMRAVDGETYHDIARDFGVAWHEVGRVKDDAFLLVRKRMAKAA